MCESESCSCHGSVPCSDIFLGLPANNTSRAYSSWYRHSEHTWRFCCTYSTAGREPTYQNTLRAA